MTERHMPGPDIDLDTEVVRDKRGRRITEQQAQRLAEDALIKAGVGRPSLSAPRTRSPEIKARVPVELRERLLRAAQERGTRPSALIREALERYLAS